MKQEPGGWRVQFTLLLRQIVEKSGISTFRGTCPISLDKASSVNNSKWDLVSLEDSDLDDVSSVESSLFPLLTAKQPTPSNNSNGQPPQALAKQLNAIPTTIFKNQNSIASPSSRAAFDGSQCANGVCDVQMITPDCTIPPMTSHKQQMNSIAEISYVRTSSPHRFNCSPSSTPSLIKISPSMSGECVSGGQCSDWNGDGNKAWTKIVFGQSVMSSPSQSSSQSSPHRISNDELLATAPVSSAPKRVTFQKVDNVALGDSQQDQSQTDFFLRKSSDIENVYMHQSPFTSAGSIGCLGLSLSEESNRNGSSDTANALRGIAISSHGVPRSLIEKTNISCDVLLDRNELCEKVNDVVDSLLSLGSDTCQEAPDLESSDKLASIDQMHTKTLSNEPLNSEAGHESHHFEIDEFVADQMERNTSQAEDAGAFSCSSISCNNSGESIDEKHHDRESDSEWNSVDEKDTAKPSGDGKSRKRVIEENPNRNPRRFTTKRNVKNIADAFNVGKRPPRVASLSKSGHRDSVFGSWPSAKQSASTGTWRI
jgi:hypothetical protein